MWAGLDMRPDQSPKVGFAGRDKMGLRRGSGGGEGAGGRRPEVVSGPWRAGPGACPAVLRRPDHLGKTGQGLLEGRS